MRQGRDRGLAKDCPDERTGGSCERAGLKVTASSEIAGPDSTLIVCLGPKFIAVRAPLRVVYVVDEPKRCGFAYGTLPGHPECGEEAFVLDSDGKTVTFTITAFSRPATLLSKVAGPVATRVQDYITERYLHSWHS